MMRTILFLLLFCQTAFAVTIEHDEQFYECDKKFSFKDFTGMDLSKEIIPSGTVVCRSGFSHEIPDSKIFPADMTGVTFVEGNLDNVFIPWDNVVIGASQKSYKIQNDLRDWEIDVQNKPVKILNEEYWTSQGYSVNPADMPAQKIAKVEDAPKAH